MSDLVHMNGHGVYVWSAYAITLGIFVLNLWLARTSHRRSLEMARRIQPEAATARRPKVRQL